MNNLAVKCLCCKKNDGNIQVSSGVTFYICGESTCKSRKGLTVGEWLLEGHDDKSGNTGNYYLIKDCDQFSLNIHGKIHFIPNDKRVVKGLHNKIRELVLKFEARNKN